MTINKNYLQQNVPSINLPTKTNFKASQNPLSQYKHDTVEIQSQIKTKNKNGLSANAKLGIGLGVIATIVGGILLHKNFAKKVTPEGQQAIRELPQAVKNLISEGRLTPKEVEMFEELKGLEGDEFVTKAYELIAKDMGLSKVPKLNIGHDGHSTILGHTGKDITIFPDNYHSENKKTEILNTLRHELEHYKQHLIVFLKKGDIAEQEAFGKQMNRRIAAQAAMKDLEANIALDEQMLEECRKYGFSNIRLIVHGEAGVHAEQLNGQLVPFSDVIKAAYEHETPIQTIRSITPCEWEKMHFSSEELANADSYLEGIRNYSSLGWLPERFFTDGHHNLQVIAENEAASNLFHHIAKEGYAQNIIEQEAEKVGESIRDKFKLFLDAIRS